MFSKRRVFKRRVLKSFPQFISMWQFNLHCRLTLLLKTLFKQTHLNLHYLRMVQHNFRLSDIMILKKPIFERFSYIHYSVKIQVHGMVPSYPYKYWFDKEWIHTSFSFIIIILFSKNNSKNFLYLIFWGQNYPPLYCGPILPRRSWFEESIYTKRI